MSYFSRDKDLVEARAYQIRNQILSQYPENPMIFSNMFSFFCVQQAIKLLSRERQIESMYVQGSYADIFMKMVLESDNSSFKLLFLNDNDFI